MLSLWQMVRGRMVGAVIAGLVMLVALFGVAEITEEQLGTIEALANAFVNFLGFIAYAIYHQWSTKRKLEAGETAPENLERLPHVRQKGL